MICRLIRSHVSPHVDGRLSVRAARRVNAHLQKCESCRADYSELRALKMRLASAPPPVAPSGFWDTLHSDLRAHAARQERPARGWVTWAWQRAPVLTAGLAVLLLAAIVPVEYFGSSLPGGGVSVDEMIAGHASYCAQQPLLEHGRMHYLVAEADTTGAE